MEGAVLSKTSQSIARHAHGVFEHELRNLRSKFLVCQKAKLSDTHKSPADPGLKCQERASKAISDMSRSGLKPDLGLDAVMASMRCPVVVFDKTNKIIRINKEARSVISLGKANMSSISKISEDALAGKTVRDESILFKDRKGLVRTAFVSASPIYGRGDIIGDVVIWHDITERKKIEESLRASERRHSLLKASTPMVIIELNPFFQITDWNPGARNTFGYEKKEVLGRNLWEIISTKQENHIWSKITHRRMSVHAVRENKSKQGKKIICEWFITPLIDESSNTVGITGIAKDITSQKEAEVKLKRSLDEKEMLLKEIHHRVKNNMQVMSSLLSLQSRKFDDERLSKAMAESMGRIKSMALIHEMLYKSGEYSNIDFSKYLMDLTNDLGRTCGSPRVSIKLDCEEAHIPMDQAISAGLLVNELITNSLKHAFPDNREGKVKVSLRARGKTYKLTVEDDGIGLPPNLDPSNSRTLGLELAVTLARQLGGKLKLYRKKGTRFEVEFAKERDKR